MTSRRVFKDLVIASISFIIAVVIKCCIEEILRSQHDEFFSTMLYIIIVCFFPSILSYWIYFIIYDLTIIKLAKHNQKYFSPFYQYLIAVIFFAFYIFMLTSIEIYENSLLGVNSWLGYLSKYKLFGLFVLIAVTFNYFLNYKRLRNQNPI